MAQLPVMPLYTDVIIADTTHLTPAEFGAYMLILIAMWRSGGSLPNDDAVLRRIARTTANNWPRVREPVLALLMIEGDRVTQKRLAAEVERAGSRRSGRAAAGRKGGLAKAQNAGSGVLTQREAGVLAVREEIVLPQGISHLDPKSLKTLNAVQAMLENSLKQKGGNAALNHKPVVREEREANASPKKDDAVGVAKPRRGTRLAEDWKPLAGDVAFATGKGCSAGRIEREAEAFRNYWVAKAGTGGTKLDWSATWRNWIISALERRPEPKAYTGGSGGWSLPAWGPGGPKT